MSYIEINKDLSQWLLTFNLCVSVTWPLTCAFHIPCTHTPEIIDMHRGVCDNMERTKQQRISTWSQLTHPSLLWKCPVFDNPLQLWPTLCYIAHQGPILPIQVLQCRLFNKDILVWPQNSHDSTRSHVLNLYYTQSRDKIRNNNWVEALWNAHMIKQFRYEYGNVYIRPKWNIMISAMERKASYWELFLETHDDRHLMSTKIFMTNNFCIRYIIYPIATTIKYRTITLQYLYLKLTISLTFCPHAIRMTWFPYRYFRFLIVSFSTASGQQSVERCSKVFLLNDSYPSWRKYGAGCVHKYIAMNKELFLVQ